MESIPLTPTRPGLSNREIAIAVIADKLGISEGDVNDETSLGNHAMDIANVVCFKTGVMLFGQRNMSAKDLFKQL